MAESVIGQPNKLALALSILRDYYTSIGRFDLTQALAQVYMKGELWEDADAEGETPEDPERYTVTAEQLENLMFIIMDNSEGAYFTKDLLTSDKLLQYFQTTSGGGYNGIEEFVKVFYSTSVGPGEDFVITATPDGLDAEIANTTGTATVDDASGEPSTVDVDESPVNANPEDPNRFATPAVSAFIFPNVRMSPATRNTGGVAMYTNSIPTIDRSRAIPFVKMNFISAVPPLASQKTRRLSLLQFLGMHDPDFETFDKIGMSTALPQKLVTELEEELEIGMTAATVLEDETYNLDMSSAGMELFTAPQTLVNAAINQTDEDGKRIYGGDFNILNPQAPFLTLESVNITVAGLGQDILANKRGTIKMVLHDRSRLAEIAPLVAAGQFAQTYIELEWGWSYPDALRLDNPFAMVVDAMKVRELFNIVATNFSIGDDGQVRLSMTIASRGGDMASSIPIGVGNVVPAAPLKYMIEEFLSKKIDEIELPADGKIPPKLRDIRQKMSVATTAAKSPTSVVPRDIFLQFMALVNSANSDEDGTSVSSKEFLALIEEMVGKFGADDAEDDSESARGLISTSGTTLTTEVQNRLIAMTGVESPDPFLPSEDMMTKILGKSVEDSSKFISLGKIFLNFVGTPLASSGNFDEVQMLYYRFNTQSGLARQYESIANFIIEESMLLSEVGNYVEAFPGMSVRGFVDFMQTKFVGKPGDINYGLQENFAERASAATLKDAEAKKEAMRLVDEAFERKLRTIYADGIGVITRPEFEIPKLKFLMETLPAMVPSSDGASFVKDVTKVICRVHIFDAQATPHFDELFLLSCVNDGELGILFKDSASSTAGSEAAGTPPPGASSGQAEKAVDKGVIEKVGDDATNVYEIYRAATSAQDIKRIIKNGVPSLTLGLANTAINTISMRSNTGGAVNNVLLFESISDEGEKKEGAGEEKPMEDVVVIPTSVSMTMMGCPLIEYGQQFFVDMGTNTTADNLYYVTGINHSLESGKFTTDVSLTYNASATMKNLRAMLKASIPGLTKDS
jgi:hypothetical protein